MIIVAVRHYRNPENVQMFEFENEEDARAFAFDLDGLGYEVIIGKEE